MASYNVHGGHNRIVPGASSYLDEVAEDRKICEEVIRPSQEECVRNSRARSTKMRWAVRAE